MLKIEMVTSQSDREHEINCPCTNSYIVNSIYVTILIQFQSTFLLNVSN